jgi:hypothetical protein
VTIKIKVGNVVKSVGFGIYKLSNNIKIPTDKEIVKKKSSIPLGRGIIIIKSIAKTKATTPKSVISLKNFSEFLTLATRFHPYNIF